MVHPYRFVIGETPSVFSRLRSPPATLRALDRLEIDGTTLLCLNDDAGAKADQVSVYMKQWMRHRWPEQAGWELSEAEIPSDQIPVIQRT